MIKRQFRQSYSEVRLLNVFIETQPRHARPPARVVASLCHRAYTSKECLKLNFFELLRSSSRTSLTPPRSYDSFAKMAAIDSNDWTSLSKLNPELEAVSPCNLHIHRQDLLVPDASCISRLQARDFRDHRRILQGLGESDPTIYAVVRGSGARYPDSHPRWNVQPRACL